jgi:hypothetical protein
VSLGPLDRRTMDACYGCGASNSGLYVVEVIGRNVRRSPRAFVNQRTSRGNIVFCEVCLEESRFRDLTAEDVDSVCWSFGSMFAEVEPARAVALLEPLVEKWQRSAEVLSPLGRALIILGQREYGRSLLAEGLETWPNHPTAAGDRTVLAAV